MVRGYKGVVRLIYCAVESGSNAVNLCLSVRMNTYSSETIGARSIKFSGNMSSYYMRSLVISEFIHTPCKSKKIKLPLLF